MFRRLVPALVLALGPSAALADAPTYPLSTPPPATTDPQSAEWGRREVIRVDPKPGEDPAEHALVSPIIYLNRCVGGCMVMPGNDDDATTANPTSAIVALPSLLSEFQFSDTVWNDFVQCMKEVYSPFNVTVTETRPGAGTQYHHAIVAGTAQEAGLDAGVLGIAIVRGDCAPRNNAVSLSLANSHTNNATTAVTLCWTAAQESAHAFGLDHAFSFVDGQSACNDPMTYRMDCGGQKFFRNNTANCGTNKVAPCNCGSSQNSHAKILATFGPNEGAQLVGPPSSTVTSPTSGSLGAAVMASAGSKRGVSKVELILNGFKWAEAKGAAFGANGQPNPSMYTLMVPGTVPNSIIDVVARACDDLGRCTDSAPVTVTKGGPCADASTCAKGQKCEAGKCFWDPPVGEVGDPCTYNEFCTSLICAGNEGSQICSQNCVPGASDSCPMDMECVATGATSGFCYPKEDGGGCCSVGNDDGPSGWFVHGGFSLLMLGLLLRRRRK